MVATLRITFLTVAGISFLSFGCGEKKESNGSSSDAEVATEDASAELGDAEESGDAEAKEEAADLFTACKEAGKDSTVTTIAEVVKFINLLPKPVSVPCFVAALPRTYTLAAAASASLPTVATREDPRFFLSAGSLIISVTKDKEGKEHVELSEYDGAKDSVKGDLVFPVEAALESTTPFAGVGQGKDAPCAACHGPGRPGKKEEGIASEALRPDPKDVLTAEEILKVKGACESSEESKCNLVRAIFFDATPKAFEFPQAMKIYAPKPAPAPAPK